MQELRKIDKDFIRQVLMISKFGVQIDNKNLHLRQFFRNLTRKFIK